MPKPDFATRKSGTGNRVGKKFSPYGFIIDVQCLCHLLNTGRCNLKYVVLIELFDGFFPHIFLYRTINHQGLLHNNISLVFKERLYFPSYPNVVWCRVHGEKDKKAWGISYCAVRLAGGLWHPGEGFKQHNFSFDPEKDSLVNPHFWSRCPWIRVIKLLMGHMHETVLSLSRESK